MSPVRAFLLGLLTGAAAVVVGSLALVWLVATPTGPAPGPRTPVTATPMAPPADLRPGETWLETVELEGGSVVTPDGGFRDVRATGADVRMTRDGLRAGNLRIEATLPFAAAAQQIGGGVQLYAADGGRAGVRRSASLLGREVEVRATGAVTARGGQLVIEPETVDLGGPDWLDAALSAAARRVATVRHTVQGLPDGMRLTRVTVVHSGFRAHLEGRNVVLTP